MGSAVYLAYYVHVRPPLPPIALRVLMWPPPIAWMVFLWWLSSQPRPESLQVSDRLPQVLAYALLAALWVRALRFTTRLGLVPGGLVAAGVGIAYGVIDEFHQSFLPGREASVLDAVADAVGAGTGALVTSLLYALVARFARAG